MLQKFELVISLAFTTPIEDTVTCSNILPLIATSEAVRVDEEYSLLEKCFKLFYIHRSGVTLYRFLWRTRVNLGLVFSALSGSVRS